MSKCILHVGMHKTGTTSIQNSLRELGDSSFYYARILGRTNHSTPISAMFARPDDPKLKGRRYRKASRNVKNDISEGRRDLDRSIADAAGRTLVISGEGILHMSQEDLGQLRDYLHHRGYNDIGVVAYIRAPSGYISSAVQQKLKAGSVNVFRLQSSLPNYRKKFEKFDSVFGRNKVRLFKFDPARFPNEDVVQDFCSRTGIPLTSIKAVRRNESITRLAAQLRFQHSTEAKSEGLRPFRGGAALCDRLRALDSTRFRLAPSLTRPVIEEIASDVRWMEERLGESLAEELVDHPDDVRSSNDLLLPVPGINAKLVKLLEEDGLSVPPEIANNTVRLVHLVAQAAKQRNLESEENSEEGSAVGRTRRAMRQEKRKARRNERSVKDRRSDGRRGARAGRLAGKGERPARERRRGRNSVTELPVQDVMAAPPVAPFAAEATTLKPAAPELVSATVASSIVPQAADQPPEALPPPARGIASVRPKEPAPQAEAKLMRSARQLMRTAGQGRTAGPMALTMGPVPLLSKEKGLIVLWSPKSACTTTYVWFSNLCGFADEVRSYASWPHRHRQEMYMKSDMYLDSANSGMKDARVLRIIRDPYGRAVSIYRHALQTHFADADMQAFSGGRISAEKGYSFQTFLDLLEQLDMRRVDIHFRPQFHPLERERKPDVVINITKSDLFQGLNAFETASGYPRTNFEDLNWLHNLESKRKAKQEPMEGDALDHVPFTRQQVARLGLFPSYAQLLTPEAKRRIEAIYKADFDAYRDFL